MNCDEEDRFFVRNTTENRKCDPSKIIIKYICGLQRSMLKRTLYIL